MIRALVVTVALLAAVPKAGPAVVVTIAAMQFAPSRAVVKPGQAVRWVNDDLVPHTVTAPGHFDSKVIAPGAHWEWVAAGSGEIPYACTLHPSMTGNLTIR